MNKLQRIEELEKEFADFMEWPSDSKQYVTSASARLFAKHCLGKQQQRIDELEQEKEQLRYDLGMKNLTAFAEGTRACCPIGYVVVPIEPTEAMIDAWWDTHVDGKVLDEVKAYKAMIQAAQEQE